MHVTIRAALALLLALSGRCWAEGSTRMGCETMTRMAAGAQGTLMTGMALQHEGERGSLGDTSFRVSGWKEDAGSMALRSAHARASLRLRGGAGEDEDEVQRLIENGCSLWDDEKDASGAERCFLKAIELSPKNEEALSSYGVLLHESSNNFQEATKYFEMALSSNPSHIDSLHFYGNMMHAMHEDLKAKMLYERAIQEAERMIANGEEPHILYVETLCNYGALLEKALGEVDAAEMAYKKALEVNPEDTSVLFNYGVLLEDRKDDVDGAQTMYLRALEIDPEDLNVLMNMALLLQNHRHDYHAAEKYFTKAMEVNPDRVDLLSNFAVFLEDIRHDTNRATELYLKALTICPEDVVTLAHYGGFLLRNGKAEEAEQRFKQERACLPQNAMEIDPEVAKPIIELRRSLVGESLMQQM
ncbi:hypothetical protein GUITHDRAFT_136323 [Guillardia theta CCMP2712]|uniref:Uncharacterized protein n=2 Tax=Guillardia theta TaxID=55529 RepID=L1JLY4_GUITC|nr:hypothetical protein GUITHDRAFT_136323 [Guillardia theta CCMP2712]EKX49165.1 hypothetical protein GUITHDRAFT_136323 [Guillardia theta CCMP2712]|eukprot:XP_005836145.1 hypothetical protein GUITHDRAFT_136323 [Guillardia theta CCMP2712]